MFNYAEFPRASWADQLLHTTIQSQAPGIIPLFATKVKEEEHRLAASPHFSFGQVVVLLEERDVRRLVVGQPNTFLFTTCLGHFKCA